MKLKSFLLTAAGLVACASAYAQADKAPEFLFPNPASDVLLTGMSDNGNWAVSQANAAEGQLTYVGVTIYDLTSYPFKKKEVKHSSGICGAESISNDGNIVGGFAKGTPAYYTVSTGEWTLLPLPEGRNAGWITDITPDGKYAIGITTLKADMFNDYNQDGCMWDLTTNQIIDLPNKPFIDRTNFDQNQVTFRQVSPDGRYVFGVISFSYVQPMAVTPFVYDRQTDNVKYIGLKKEGNKWTSVPSELDNIPEGTMSPDGKYITGSAYMVKDATDLSATEYDIVYRYDIQNDKLELFDGQYDRDYAGFSVGNTGTLYAATPAMNPYSFGAVRHGNYYYSFSDIFEQLYDINIADIGLSNTGKPVLLSEDEKTIVMYKSTSNCYVLKLKETLSEAASRIQLLGKYTVAPAAGTTMQTISTVTVTFNNPVSTSSLSYRNVKLLDKDGNTVTTALQSGGLTTNGTTLTIRFRNPELKPGETYTVLIPEGTVWLGDDTSMKNPEIRINYIGRGEGAVKMVSASPADGSKISALSLLQDPIILTFDSEVMLNDVEGQATTGAIYREGDDYPVAYLSIYGATTGDKHQMLVAPLNEVKLYLSNNYVVEIPAGVAVDLSGNGPSEAITLKYTGTYQRQIGDDDGVIFSSDCNNYQGFLFYDGDKGTPVPEMAQMGFTVDTTPWVVVRSSEQSTDMAFGSHSMYVDGRQANDWVMTEQLFIRDNTAYMTFDSQSYRKNKQDRLKVYLLEDNMIYNTLTPTIVEKILSEGVLLYDEIQSPGESEDKLEDEWTNNTIDLGDYAGKNVYIAFLNDNQDQSMVLIDNVHIAVEVNAVIDFNNATNVVDRDDIKISGQVIIPSENTLEYRGISLVLKDQNNKEVSKIEDASAVVNSLNAYPFEFSEALPLEKGVENAYVVEMTLGEGEDQLISSINGKVRNLTFAPTRRIVLEEYTGRTCPNCPRGLRAIDIIKETYKDQFIPIAIHTYHSDPKGNNVTDYSSFLGLEKIGAPSARVNRGANSTPMTRNSQTTEWVYNVSQLAPGQVPDYPLWYDLVQMYYEQPTTIDVDVELLDTSDNNTMRARATVKSAIDMPNVNYRVFGVMLENGLVDFQQNGMYQVSDPVLGEWGRGGLYGDPVVYDVTFDHVAVGTWGTSFAGTGGLIPNELKASDEYTIDIEMPFPAIVKHVYNCDFVVMIIDENTGEVLNAAITTADSGVDSMTTDNAALTVTALNGALQVNSASDAQVAAYTLDGRMIANAQGNGSFSVDLGGYNGVVIVKATTAEKSTSFKLMTR